ncbi:16S rRNA (adenine(1518)-N(6)/adenine(1519)-N(6))-dimethyltransferase RsmA [Candidatus Shikimatogenerans bostrichidophilus]|uniref:16S rRNA (adenine(1518)-N(6)/adenine(1519)-N(6))- dimethyltransferase RsmA n=1 Tax=Candidatus Shikimatogenerans bostrichidophilus TaxID=2943807 RepID=UPI0029668DAF
MKIKKYYSQNFLINNNYIIKIVNILKISKINYDCILEIGAGIGNLSKELIKIKNKKIILIEIDKYLFKQLKKKFIVYKIINKNILNCNLKKLGYKKYYIIGNFPYNISSKLILWIIQNKKYIVECIGMFQKEFVNSIFSINDKFKTKLSIYINLYFKVIKLFNINNNNFFPIPKVNSTVIKLKKKKSNLLKINNINEKKFFLFIKECFKYKRKIIKNSLFYLFNKININNKLFFKRIDELNIYEIIKLYKIINKYYNINEIKKKYI